MLVLPQGPRPRRRDRAGPLEPGAPRLRLGVPRHPHPERRHQSRLHRPHGRARRRPRAEGTLRTEGDRLIVGDTTGRRRPSIAAEVETTSPSSDLDHARGAGYRPRSGEAARPADVPSHRSARPARNSSTTAPLRRAAGRSLTQSSKAATPVENPRRLRIVLAGGPKDHGPGEHDYPCGSSDGRRSVATDQSVTVETADGWPSLEAARNGGRGRLLFQQPRLGRGEGRGARPLPRARRRRRPDPLRGRRP